MYVSEQTCTVNKEKNCCLSRQNNLNANSDDAFNQVQTPLFQNEDSTMNLHLSIGPLAALIAGILILAMPRLLNFIVALYLIIIGLVGLLGTGNFHL